MLTETSGFPQTQPQPARIAVMDSGIGGLSVFAEIRQALPGAELLYFADDAAFPYGRLDEYTLVPRVAQVVEAIIDRHAPDLIVLACNTASTLCLPTLRSRFSVPFVGTVPAIKPAALQSQSRCISILATPGTLARDYTRELIATHAGDCHITAVPSPDLAAYAEAELRGEPVADGDILAAIAPAFVEYDGRRTDTVVLACTHYPFLLHRFTALAPWPVAWLDAAAAIARRTASLIGDRPAHPAPRHQAHFTSGASVPKALQLALQNRSIAAINPFPVPFELHLPL